MKLRPWSLPSVSCLLILAGGVALALIPNPAPIRLAFDYPTNGMSTNLTFILHGASNVGAPLTNWPVDNVIPATNWYANGTCTAPVAGTNYVLTFTNLTVPAQRFWYIVASNFWGVSDPSNVLALDPLPARTQTLRAERAW